MHGSVLLLVVAVVVCPAPPTRAAFRTVYNGWITPRRSWPTHSYDSPYYRSFDYGYPEDRRWMEDDYPLSLVLLLRLLEREGRSQVSPPPVHPILRLPFSPNPDKGVGGNPCFHGCVDKDSGDDETNIFLDSPTPGPEWDALPFLPEFPNADDLPDNYDNSTHEIHVVNGSRVEVNTTTHKETDDSITTFFHTEVIHILPGEEPKVKTPQEKEDTTETILTFDEETTEGPVPSDATMVEEEEYTTTTTTENPEEPPVEDETVNELPFHPGVVPAEIIEAPEVRGGDFRAARGVTREESNQEEQQRSASYVKRPRGGKSKGKGAKEPPKDLSGDTKVNDLPGNTNGGRKEDPDAETINEEFL